MKQLFLIAFAIIALAGCANNNDDPTAFVPTQTDFDITTIESKKYSFGDTVKADINIKPDTDIKELETDYIIQSSFNPPKSDGTGWPLPNFPANGTKPFVYKLKLPLTNPDLKGKAGVTVLITSVYTKIGPNNAIGDKIIKFNVYLK